MTQKSQHNIFAVNGEGEPINEPILVNGNLVQPQDVDTLSGLSRVQTENLDVQRGLIDDLTSQTNHVLNASEVEVELSSNQSLTAATLAQVEFSSVVRDSRTEYDSGNYEWVPDEEGVYLVKAAVEFVSPADGDRLLNLIRVNGNTVQAQRRAGGTGFNQTVTCTSILNLAAGDVVTVHARNNDGADEISAAPERTNLQINEVYRLGN